MKVIKCSGFRFPQFKALNLQRDNVKNIKIEQLRFRAVAVENLVPLRFQFVILYVIQICLKLDIIMNISFNLVQKLNDKPFKEIE